MPLIRRSFHTRKTIGTYHEDVLYTTIFQLVQNAKPVLCTLVFTDMYGQHFFVTCQAYCKDYICCKLFLSVLLYRKMYSINKYNGVNLVKRTFLPVFYLRKETVCDIGYHR